MGNVVGVETPEADDRLKGGYRQLSIVGVLTAGETLVLGEPG
jgi:hypothetical protein